MAHRPSQSAPRSPRFALLLLALAAGIAIITIRMAVRRPLPPVAEETPSRMTQSEQVLAKARPLTQQGQYDAAAALMEAHLRMKPRDVAVRVQLAETLLAAGRADEAEATIDVALRRTPQSARALWFKGLLVQQRGGENAEYFFAQAVRSPDATAEIWAGYGLLLLDRGQDEQAEVYLARAREAGLADERTLGPLGELALRREDYAAAAELLTAAVEQDRANPRLWAMLAEAQQRLGRDEEAAETLGSALAACEEGRGRLQLALADVLDRLDRRAEAARARAAAAELLTDDEQAGQWRRAIEQLDVPQTQPQ